MARAGAFKANLFLTGFKRSDPFPTRIRRLRTVAGKEKVLVKAMANAAKDMRNSMESLAPIRTGVLSQSFSIRKLKRTPPFIIGIRVGAVSGPRVASKQQVELAKIDGVEAGDSYNAAGWRDHWAELGTRFHGPQPHVQPAIRKNLATYQLKLRRELGAIFQTQFYRNIVAKGG